MRSFNPQSYRISILVALVAANAKFAAAQPVSSPPEGGMGVGFYFMCLVVASGLIGGWILWKRSKATPAVEVPESKYNYMTYNHDGDSYDVTDAERDMEWLRKAKRSNKRRRQPTEVAQDEPVPVAWASPHETGIDTREFQEKMRKLQYTQLPINSFSQLAQAKKYKPLEISDDPSLLTAIEQANEEYEEDESVRDLAVRILTAFRTRNSVEALSQIAMYDLSSNLRSKAVSVLADFDHETVFETLLLACADPTREVRAAAARGMFRLSFDRAHAWTRIIEANDDFRMSHAARAAIESGIVGKSLDRLIHEDLKVAYEAFALVSLLISANETDPIFDALRDHKDDSVKYALLHVLRVHGDPRTLDKLNELRVGRSWPTEISDRIRETVNSFSHVGV